MKLKNKTKESIAYIGVFLSVLLPITLSVQNWLNTEETIVLAKTTASPSPSSTIGQVESDELPEAGEAVELIKEIFGDEWETAYAIAMAESHMNPDRVHKDDIEWSIGLFQINIRKGNGEGAKVHWDKIPGDTGEEKEAWLKVPENNILTAKFIYGSSGFYPWTVFKNGVYLDYLPNDK